MTPDVIDRLRASNPLPHGSTAPELETVLARLQTAAPRRRRVRPLRLLVAALAVSVPVLVVIGTLGGLHAHHHAAVSRRHLPASPPTIPTLPRGGMRGLVGVVGAGFSSSSDGVISLQQCLGCLANGNQTAHSRDIYWLARTTDGGRSWSLAKERFSIQQPLFAGQDGWAGGLEAMGSQAGGVAQYYVTHDAGRTWRVAPAAAPNQGGALVSIGGDEVWATGLTATNVTIMHAPVAGSRLRATVSQPIHGGWTNVQVFGGGAGTAYVTNGDMRRQTFATHDDGRSWQRIQPPCPRGVGGGLAAAYGDAVWAQCYSPGSPRPMLFRSDNGGRTWQQLQPNLALSLPPQPVSPESAWAMSGDTVLRTTDGGVTWRPVWSAASSQPPSLRGQTPARIAPGGFNPLLMAESPASASLVQAITRGGARAKLTNLVVYRTTNGGRTWHAYVVPLGTH